MNTSNEREKKNALELHYNVCSGRNCSCRSDVEEYGMQSYPNIYFATVMGTSIQVNLFLMY